MVSLKVRVGPKGQIVIPKVIRERLGIEPGNLLLIDERNGKIVIERSDVDELVRWLKENRKKIARDVYKFSLEDEF
ncbi:AbrB/MazE/SpoVT family DNA-binding domain-containing protein [Archaeoglobus neptunius]|uniref:AbrB/MazE/SpoVT family DNA-binding domain-containing protein n=1 Tax=Archaeoglobus neptunius TaxID=2798580 RepID=UPI001927A219|nr:AbrB/MazE/SpoVT family DNA-binding domain-containing protein [Archaeoglobus neptunius]